MISIYKRIIRIFKQITIHFPDTTQNYFPSAKQILNLLLCCMNTCSSYMHTQPICRCQNFTALKKLFSNSILKNWAQYFYLQINFFFIFLRSIWPIANLIWFNIPLHIWKTNNVTIFLLFVAYKFYWLIDWNRIMYVGDTLEIFASTYRAEC